MFNKEENADTEVGAIMKKLLIGGLFVIIFPIALPALTGVDLVNLCVTAEGGEEADDNGCKVLAENRLSAGFDGIKPLVVLGIDMFIILFVVVLLFGPGTQLARYRFDRDAPR